jgi:hypothetical protein
MKFRTLRAQGRTDLEVTGELQLVIDEYWDRDIRKRWSDGKRGRVEDLVGRALVSFDVLIERERVTCRRSSALLPLENGLCLGRG